ncbi:patatin-domain-containing protein [Neoconidiobolus thromboides FSU 785]|nr:patatin-domain-containing protein [Neoconidiobolus thromboides FSU 785]
MDLLESTCEVTSDTCSIPFQNRSVLQMIYSVIYELLLLITYRIPTSIFLILSKTITISFNYKTLLFLFILAIILFYIYVRYRYHTNYSRLPETEAPPKQSDAFDLQPIASHLDDSDDESNLGHYPNEFLKSILSSIKIFGYLEEPVFNELSRYLNTKRVVKGDIIFDGFDKEKSFYIVVDGCVQVSTKRNVSGYFADQTNDKPSENILTEVKAGGTLSSLFTLLSLFTENVELKRAANSDFNYQKILETIGKVHEIDSSDNHSDAYLNIDNKGLALVKHDHFVESPGLKEEPLHPHVTARATCDSTLAVIPAEAFQRLIKKFPSSSAHIVQVILTRFQRVTFLTLNNYLGMSKELLEIEKKVSDLANYNVQSRTFDPKHTEAMLDVAKGINSKLSLSRSNSSKDIDSSKKKATIAAETIIPNERNSNSVIHISENALSNEEEEEIYSSLRKQSYQLILDSIGMTPNIHLISSSAGDLSRAQSSPYSRDSDEIEEDSDYSEEDVASSTISPSGTYSPNSLKDNYEDHVELYYLKSGATMISKGERLDGIYLVLHGSINITNEDEKPALVSRKSSVSLPNFGKEHLSHKHKETSRHKSKKFSSYKTKSKGGPTSKIREGCVAGYLGSITGTPSFINMTAAGNTLVACLPRKYLDRLTEKHPAILLTLAKRLIHRLPPLVLQIDFALEWVQASAGKVLCKQDDICDAIYIVLNGRLRTIAESEDQGINILAEYGLGDSVGELEMLTNSPLPFTLHAIRDSELARMPKSLFDAISLANPEVTIQISRMIARRTMEQQASLRVKSASSIEKTSFGKNNTNLKTVAIVPVKGNVPIQEFSARLRDSFQSIGESVQVINSASVHSALGRHAFTKMGKLKLKNWLIEQEERHRIVLLTADGAVNSPWTRQCIRQADCILLIGIGSEDPSIGEFERLLISSKTTARKELVLLHPDHMVPSGSTQNWLKSRLWIHAHHHVQFPLKRQVIMKNVPPILSTLNELKDQLHQYYADVAGVGLSKKSIHQPSSYTGIRSDFSRLARRLCGRSIGLVLGGGGARGIAHLGFIRALEEAGIPIDIVGGCSIGAYVGGLYARDSDTVAMFAPARVFSNRMASLWRKVTDLTYPIISWFSGHEFNRGIWKTFKDIRIEDLWLPYYCVTTNITHSRLEVHQSGYLWRYVRASMSLSGFLPPLCDGNNLLLDGGYLDYLPVEVMHSMGVETIFALDVAGEDNEDNFTNYGDSLSGWYVVLSKLNPFYRPKILSLADIQSRLAYISSVSQIEAAKKIPGCLYIRLPVQKYGTLEFGSFTNIEAVGYAHGQKCVQTWHDEGLISTWTNSNVSAHNMEKVSSTISTSASTPNDYRPRFRRRNSF